MKQEYGIIFDHPKATLEWVNQYTLILKIEGTDKSLKPGLFIAHSDVVPVADNWDTDPFNPEIDDYIRARGVYDAKVLL